MWSPKSLKKLFALRRSSKAKKNVNPTYDWRGRRLQMEPLEVRTLLTTSLSLASGTLSINISGASENVSLQMTAANNLQFQTNSTITSSPWAIVGVNSTSGSTAGINNIALTFDAASEALAVVGNAGGWVFPSTTIDATGPLAGLSTQFTTNASTFANNAGIGLKFNANSGAVTVGQNIIAQGGGSVTLGQTAATNIGANITTAGGAIALTPGTVQLTNAVTLDTTSGGGSANISLGTVTAGVGDDLTLVGGNAGGEVVSVGNMTSSAKLTVTSSTTTSLNTLQATQVTTTATTTNLNGNVTTTGAGGGAGGIVLHGAVQLLGDSQLINNAAGQPIKLAGAVTCSPASAFQLTLTAPGGAIQMQSGANILKQLTVTDSASTTISGNLQVSDLSVTGDGPFIMNGSTNNITDSATPVIFANTGGVTLVAGGGPAVTTFYGGVTVPATETTSINGSLKAAGKAIMLGPVTLPGDGYIDTTAGSNPGGAAITVGNVTGGTNNLYLTSGTGGAISGAAVTATSLTINNGITNTSTGVSFSGAVNVGTLTTGPGTYPFALNGNGNNISNLVTFSNTGGVTLVNGAGYTSTFLSGVTVPANDQVSLFGTVFSNGTPMNLSFTAPATYGSVVLAGDATVDTTNGPSLGGNTINIGNVTGAHQLTLVSGTGGAIAGGSVGGGVTTLSINSGITNTNVTGVSFAGAVQVATLTTGPGTYPFALNYAGPANNTVTNPVTFTTTGLVTLVAGGNTSLFSGGVTTAGNTSIGGAVNTGPSAPPSTWPPRPRRFLCRRAPTRSTRRTPARIRRGRPPT